MMDPQTPEVKMGSKSKSGQSGATATPTAAGVTLGGAEAATAAERTKTPAGADPPPVPASGEQPPTTPAEKTGSKSSNGTRPANVPKLALGFGIQQHVRDIEEKIQTEVLTARQQVIQLEFAKKKAEERVQNSALTQKELGKDMEKVKDEALATLKAFQEVESRGKQLQGASFSRFDKQIRSIRIDVRGLAEMLKYLDSRVGRIEDELGLPNPKSARGMPSVVRC